MIGYESTIIYMSQSLHDAFLKFIMYMGEQHGNQVANDIFGIIVNAHLLSMGKAFQFIIDSMEDTNEKEHLFNTCNSFMIDINEFLKDSKYFQSATEISH